MQPQAKEVIKEYERSLVKVILYCICELPFSFGKKKIVGVLRGSKSSYVVDHELYRLDTYGILPDFKGKYLNSIIESLLDRGLLKVEMVSDFHNRPTLTVTQEGKKFLDGLSSTEILFAARLSDKEVILLDDQEQVLYDCLRGRRRNLASDKDVPPYVICHNTSLREIAKKKPQSEMELLQINGIGKKFVTNYGEDFLSVIKQFDEPEQLDLVGQS